MEEIKKEEIELEEPACDRGREVPAEPKVKEPKVKEPKPEEPEVKPEEEPKPEEVI